MTCCRIGRWLIGAGPPLEAGGMRRSALARGGALAFGAALTLGAGLTACRPGGPDSGPTQLSASGAGAYEVALTRFRDGAAVAWYDLRDGNAEIYLRLLDAHGELVGDERRLTIDNEESYEPSIAAAGDALAVGWYGKRADESLRAYVGVWEPATGWRWRQPVSGETPSRNPVVRARGDEVFAAWIEADEAAAGSETIRFAFWRTDGTEITGPHSLAAAGRETWNLNAALDDERGSAFVAFDAPDDSGSYELFLAQIDSDGQSLVRQLSASDGHASKYPDIALLPAADGRLAALTWFDDKDGNEETYLAVAPVGTLRDRSIDADARRLSHSPGPSIGSYLAWNGETIGVAWSDEAQSYDIFFQSFDAGGNPLNSPLALTSSGTDSFVPAIVAWGDGFAVAWNEIPAGNDDLHNATGSEVFFEMIGVDAGH